MDYEAINILNNTRRRPDIDGIKGLAILLVLAYHGFPSLFSGGYIGVDVFFVVSGFLIGKVVIEGLSNSSFSITEFYFSRVNRIFPALILLITGCVLLGKFLLNNALQFNLVLQSIFGGLFLSNLYQYYQTGYFMADNSYYPLKNLWSLAVEVQFYLFAPLIIKFLWLKKTLNSGLLLIGLLSFIYCIYLSSIDQPLAFLIPITRLWEFDFGILTYLLILKLNIYKYSNSEIFYRLVSVTGIVSLIGISLVLNEEIKYPSAYALIPVLISCLLIVSCTFSKFSKKIFSNIPLVYLGIISYGLYLWHWPLLIIGNDILDQSNQIYIILIYFITALLAYFSFRFEFFLKKFKNKVRAISLLILMGALLLYLYFFPYTSFSKSLSEPSDQIGWKIPVAPVEEQKNCYDFTKLKIPWCYLKAANNPNVAIIGDSSTLALYAAVRSDNGINPVLLASPSTPFLYGVTTSTLDSNVQYKENYKNTIMAIDYVINNKSIKTVILSWQNGGRIVNDNPQEYIWYPGEKIKTKSHNIKILQNSLKDTYNLLIRAGKNVIIIAPILN